MSSVLRSRKPLCVFGRARGEEKTKARGGRWEGIVLRALAIFRSLLYFYCYYPAGASADERGG